MKKISNRILSILLAVILAFLSVDVTAFAVNLEIAMEEEQEDDFANEIEEEVIIEEADYDGKEITETELEGEIDSESEEQLAREEEEIPEDYSDDENKEEIPEDYSDDENTEEIPADSNFETEQFIEEEVVILTQETTEDEEGEKYFYELEEPETMKNDNTEIVAEDENAEQLSEKDETEVILQEEGTEESDLWGDILEIDRLMYADDATKIPEGLWVAGLKEEGYTYSGTNIVFTAGTDGEIRVYDGKILLKPDQDYTISYKNNKNAYELKAGEEGYNEKIAPTVIIKGKGNYSGSISETFVINKRDLSQKSADGTDVFQTTDVVVAENGKVQKKTTKVTYVNEAGKTVTLKEKTDYFYEYPNTDKQKEGYDANAFKKAGVYTVVVRGNGNYKGSISFQQTITKCVLVSKVKVASIPTQDFKNMEEIKPEITITYKGDELKEYNEETGEGHYTLKYENNQKPGTARVIVTGVEENGYAGTKVVNFKIKGYDLKKAKLEDFQSSYTYTGDNIVQEKVKFSYAGGEADKLELVEDIHYFVKYEENIKAGTVKVTYTGNEENGWTGSVKKTFKIKPYDLNNDEDGRITVKDASGQDYPQNVVYVKGGVKPAPVVTYTSPKGQVYHLLEGRDYTLSYLNNKKVNEERDENKSSIIKITGKGNFKGTRQKDTFMIGKSDLNELTVNVKDKVYSKKKGNYVTSVEIIDRNGKKLSAGADYEKQLKYYYYESVYLANGTYREAGEEIGKNDIVPAGTVLEVQITGKGAYVGEGEKAAQVTLQYRMIENDISKATVKIEKQYYTGKEICPNQDQMIVTMNGQVLTATDYEIVSYTDNLKKGTAKVTIKGLGNYGGTKVANFNIAEKSMYYVISFHPNGANAGTMKDMQVKAGQSYSLNKNAYKKKGYRFVGWNTKADGSGVDAEGNKLLYADQAKEPVLVGKTDMGKRIILYAQWEIVVYKITYKIQDGVNHEQNPSTYTIDDEIKLKEPTRKGYIFIGWYTDSKCTESKKISKISKGSTGNKVLYAKWRVSFVGSVEKPEDGTYLNVIDYGAIPNDSEDDTNAIERAVREASWNYEEAKEESEEALENVIHTVYIPEGTYNITAGHAHNDGDPGISLKSNVILIMDSKAILKVGKSSYEDYCVISAKNVENITIMGGRIEGERYRHLGNSGEGGHGIALYGARNVKIINVSVASNWGDGIYFGTQTVRQPDNSQKAVGCNNVTVRNCDIFDNRRSNVSITDADNLTMEHCYLFDAHGTAPQCGICIEPNSNSSGDRICRNIVLKDTTISAYQNKNDAEYMCFMTHYNPYISGYTTSDGIWFKNCTFNGWVGNYSGNNLKYDDKTVFNGEFVNMR